MPANEGWQVTVFGTKILDKTVQPQRSAILGGFGIDRYTPGRPQEFGVGGSVRF